MYVCTHDDMTICCSAQVFLSAMAWWNGSEVGGTGAGKDQLNYVAFGAGVSEVGIELRAICCWLLLR